MIIIILFGIIYSEESGEKMTVAFYTLGCKVNQYETNLMMKQFEDNNFQVVNFEDKPDIFVVNSCSVTNLSTRKTRQILSRAKKANNEAIVILVGCYAEEIRFSESKNVNNDIFDIVLGNEEKKDIITHLNKFLDSGKSVKEKKLFKVADIAKVKRYVQSDNLNKGVNVLRESVKIEDGCDNFCSYCIIPYTRGRVRSRSIDDIITEVENLVKNGAKEIVIVGIEIASYGKDLEEDISLIDVIERINDIDGLERIRLGSIEPRWLTDLNILRLSKLDKLCNHFHLSVQSLSNSVLKRMNRKYTREYLFDVSDKLKKTFKDIALTCDIIVGYIDETDEEFTETLEGAKRIDFSDMHVFKFSKREHTRAYSLTSTVNPNVANSRSEELITLGNELKLQFLNTHIGKTMKVLLEEYKDGYLYGYTSNYIRVKVKGDKELWGKIQELELVSLEKDLILGIIK